MYNYYQKPMSARTFYLLSFTWGLLMTLIGAIAVGAIKLFGLITKKHFKFSKFGYCFHLQVGEGWGGINLGAFFLSSTDSGSYTNWHEHGHAIQNCIWGPLFPFVVCIPSAFRYWVRLKPTQESKYKFAFLIFSIAQCISVLFFVLCVMFNPLIIGIPSMLILYFLLVFTWMVEDEIPKYKNPVAYDDIWFESEATNIGNYYKFYIEGEL